MNFNKILRNPTEFLNRRSQKEIDRLLISLKESYDRVKRNEKSDHPTAKKRSKPSPSGNVGSSLPTLLIKGFDVEQIWQQIELLNKDYRRSSAAESDQPSTSRKTKAIPIEEDDQGDVDFPEDDDDESNLDDREGGGELEPDEDDEEMEEGLVDEDEDEERGEFDDPDGEEAKEEEDDDEDMELDDIDPRGYGESDDEEPRKEEKSAFEKQQNKLKQRIEEFEDQILSDKPWQLTGEVTANKRPENSLLEEHLFYDHATKLPPVITQETTESLESLIIRRIKDQAWDDVERKVKPINAPYAYKNELVLDQEKSKISLSQIYEQEYLKKTTVSTEEKKNPKHEEIRKSMKELFFKLDLLTSNQYTPKPLAPELKVVNNMPSIRMEEVAPVAISDAALLAPEEVKEKQKGEMKAKEERTREDKKRELRSKKKHQKLRAAKREKAESKNPNKPPKDKMKMLKKVGKIRRVEADDSKGKKSSSKDFFSRLQKQVDATVSDGKKSAGIKKHNEVKKSGADFKT